MFNLLPWRWTHWLLLFIGPLFVVVYLTLLSWVPVDQAIQRLAASVGPPAVADLGMARAEAIFSLITLALLTPLAGIMALFLLLFALVAVSVVLGPFVRVLGLPDWLTVLLLGSALAVWVYSKIETWLPWSLWLVDRLATIYVVLIL